MFLYYITKEQVEVIYSQWEIDFVLPTQNLDSITVFPGDKIVRLRKTSKKSTYGKPLFELSIGKHDEVFSA